MAIHIIPRDTALAVSRLCQALRATNEPAWKHCLSFPRSSVGMQSATLQRRVELTKAWPHVALERRHLRSHAGAWERYAMLST